MDNTLSRTFSALRFPLTFCVVLAHMAALSRCHWLTDFIYIFFNGTFQNIVVPTFLFISSYLFFSNLSQWNTNVFAKKMKSRVRTLLVPYLLWNLLPLTLGIVWVVVSRISNLNNPFPELAELIANTDWGKALWGTSDIGAFLHMQWGVPADMPLWYLRNLIVLVILSPLVYFFVRRLGLWFVIPFVVVFGVVFKYGSLVYSAYFVMGAYFSICRRPVVPACRRARLAVHICAAATLALCMLSWYIPALEAWRDTLDGIFCIVWPLAIVYATYFLVDKGLKTPKILAESSFFVYALHSFYMTRFGRIIMETLLPWDNVAIQIIRYLMSALVAYGLCVAVYAVLKRFCPRLLGLYTGSRFSVYA